VEGGAHSTELLHRHAAELEPRDRALATELVLGLLRRKPQMDHLVRHFSGRDPAKLDGEVRLALQIGIYQLRCLDRIPAHAAVGESVELVRRARKRSAMGLVNAVLRKVNREPVPWPDRATELCVPAWMLDRWERRFGRETAERIARAALAQPESYIRVPAGAAPPEDATGGEVPGCFRVGPSGPGRFRQQDIGSQAIVGLLELRPGDRFLDLCAAPGGKTAQALETPVTAIACDRALSRLLEMKSIGCPLCVADALFPLPFRAEFDRVLVDAPCSGTGTLARNPEIRWRLTPEDLVRQQERQRRILANAMAALEPGGRLVYSTCSLEAEENEEVTAAVLAQAGPGWRKVSEMRRIPGVEAGDGFYAAVITSGEKT
jgi:16S rRNA (cytosine967-C5)-methyltransferase